MSPLKIDTRPTLHRRAALRLGGIVAAGGGLARRRSAPAAGGGLGIDDVLSLDRVHRVGIEVDPAHFHTLDTDRSQRVPCAVTIDGRTFTGARIKEKGYFGSSQTLDGKPGFTITFDGPRPKGMKKLTLNNAVQDRSFLHEHLVYELHRRAGLAAPRTAHAVVDVNDREYGLYVMVQHVDEPFLEDACGEGNGEGNLYELINFELFLAVSNHDFIDLKDAEDGRTREDLEALVKAAHAPDEQLEAALSQTLNLEAFITNYALECVLACVDGFAFNNNNCYLYCNPGDRKFLTIGHGQDRAFDCGFDPLTPPKARLMRRFRAVRSLDERYRAEMNRVMAEAWDVQKLLNRMDRVAQNVRAVPAPGSAMARDLARFNATYRSMFPQITERLALWRPL
jgi:spore coat protein H